MHTPTKTADDDVGDDVDDVDAGTTTATIVENDLAKKQKKVLKLCKTIRKPSKTDRKRLEHGLKTTEKQLITVRKQP